MAHHHGVRGQYGGAVHAVCARCAIRRICRRAALANLGACCMAMKLYGEAVEHLNEALKIGDPNDARLINRRGRAQMGRGEFAHAKRDFERALTRDPDDGDALAGMEACRAAFEADARAALAFAPPYDQWLARALNVNRAPAG